MEGELLYDATHVYAVSASAVSKDARLSQAQRDQLAEQYAGRAVALLTQADSAGFFKDPAHIDHLKADKDLDSLRSRADFKKFLSEVESATLNFCRERLAEVDMPSQKLVVLAAA